MTPEHNLKLTSSSEQMKCRRKETEAQQEAADEHDFLNDQEQLHGNPVPPAKKSKPDPSRSFFSPFPIR